jgi:ADP-ribosylglycohydrolase
MRGLVLILLILISMEFIVRGAETISNSILSRIQYSFKLGLIGDALSLGGHYEYDAKKIKKRGGFSDYAKPGEDNNGIGWGTANYHPGKIAGDMTDAGEVAVMLLKNLVEEKSYSFDSFASFWKKQIDEGYGSCNFQSVGRDAKECPKGLKPGYINGGSRRTLQSLAYNPNAKGNERKALASNANCLFGATHFLPIFLLSGDTTPDEEKLVQDAISTSYISHNNPDPIAAAEFLTRTLYRMFYQNMALPQALQNSATRMNHHLINKWLLDAQNKVIEATDPNSALSKEEFVDDISITSMSRLWDVGRSEPIKIGKASPTEGALPSALYFSLKYKDNVEAGLIANANCGGDSAVRGIVIGMLLGAQTNVEQLPRTHRWMTGLNMMKEVETLMEKLSTMQKSSPRADI